MALYADVTSFPPLARITTIPANSDEVPFTVNIEWSKINPAYPWDVQLCYRDNTHTGSRTTPWQTLTLKRIDRAPTVITSCPEFEADEGDRFYATFEGALPIPAGKKWSALSFTIKSRADTYSPWNWPMKNKGIEDGVLVFQSPHEESFQLADVLSLEHEWHVESVVAATAAGHGFTITSAEAASRSQQTDSTSDWSFSTLGQVPKQVRWVALTRSQEPWLAPRQGRRDFDVDEDAMLCCFVTETGHHLTLLALNSPSRPMSIFRPDEDGRIVVSMRKDDTGKTHFVVVAAVADTAEKSITEAVSTAQAVLSKDSPTSTSLQTVFKNPSESSTISPKQEDDGTLDEWFDRFGFCTYNALGRSLTTERIIAALDDLAKANIMVSNLIIDDNWQSIDGVEPESGDFVSHLVRRWTDFEANEKFSAGGLKEAIGKIRSSHPHIIDIAVWHALLGYWGAMAEDSSLGRNYNMQNFSIKNLLNTTQHISLVNSSDISKMYDDFYAFLASCGVTAVKTDNQCQLDAFLSPTDRASLSPAYQAAWTAAYTRHFGGKAISCMSMIPQILFGAVLVPELPRIIIRNSDDYFPEIAASHPWHIFTNAHNALLTRNFNALPDWDMFQTGHQFSEMHAAARCISGGPIYVTDVPGDHDVALIRRMTATNLKGQTISLRPSQPARTMDAYSAFVDEQVLTVGTYTGESGNGTGIFALFNISAKTNIMLVSPLTLLRQIDDVSAPKTGQEFLVRSYRRGCMAVVKTATEPQDLLYCKLTSYSYDILSVHRLHRLGTSTSKDSIAVLGLWEKMTGAAAVTSSSFGTTGEGDQRRAICSITVKALGVCAWWYSGTLTHKSSVEVKVRGTVVPGELIGFEAAAAAGAGTGAGTVVTVDLLKAVKGLAGLAEESTRVLEVELIVAFT